MTGGLALIHRLILKTRDFPGCPGHVTNLRWTPDGTALAMTWAFGGFSIWSTFGSMVMCSLCWDYGPNVSDPVAQNPLCLSSIVRKERSKYQHRNLLFSFLRIGQPRDTNFGWSTPRQELRRKTILNSCLIRKTKRKS